MKVKIEFNLPDDDYDYKCAINGSNFVHIINELDEYCRQQVKYSADDWKDKSPLDAFNSVRSKLRELSDEVSITNFLF